MGQLVLGLAGAFIGNMIAPGIGASVGFALGSFAYTLLDPVKIQGPRLQDTKVRGADYGTMRPILYGSMRIGGLGMGQGSTSEGPNKFTEHKEKSGGKGGPQTTSYRYTLSFFNEICEGPIVGVGRRWVNNRLMTEEETDSNDNWPFTLYLGTDDQLPDPTMELVYGVGEVAPMRGVAYEVVTEKDVTDVGNVRPNVEYEAFTSASVAVPRRIAYFRPWPYTEGPPGVAPTSNYTATRDPASGIITITSIRSNFPDLFFHAAQWLIDGTAVTSDTTTTIVGTTGHVGVRNLNANQIDVTGDGMTHWYGVDALCAAEQGAVVTDTPRPNGSADIYVGGYIFTPHLVGTTSHLPTYIRRWNAPSGVPGGYSGLEVSLGEEVPDSDVGLGSSDDGHLYVMYRRTTHDSSGAFAQRLIKFDTDLNIVHDWSTSEDVTATRLTNWMTGNFFVYNNLICFQMNTVLDGVNIALVKINADYSLENHGELMPTTDTVSQNFTISLGGCLGMDEHGTFSLCGGPGSVPLGDIVYDLCIRAGLTDTQIDVSDLTQDVRGFVVASQMTAHNAIDTLRRAFFFDPDDSDGVLIFKNRGSASIATIPDGDLAAHEFGAAPPEPLEITRVNEAELPRTVSLKYYDLEHDYQPGSVYWRRTVTSSQSDVTIDLPIVLTVDEAMRICQWHMHFAWLERERYVFSLTRKWVKLTKTDVVNVRGVDMRITSRTESPSGLIKFEAVRAHAGPYTPAESMAGGSGVGSPGGIPGETPGAPGSGQPGQELPLPKADTAAILLDVPWLTEAESANSFRVALYQDGTGSWPGAALYKSVDGGTTYTVAAESPTAAIVGTVASALGDFDGGNIVDESNVVRVTLVDDTDTLTSTTSEGLTNGLNLITIGTAADGWEILQYRTATLVSAGVYDLSGLLRGGYGTEWMMDAHVADESFVLLSTTVLVPIPQAHLGLTLQYKAVTYGTALADAVAVPFICQGIALKPLAPVLLGGGRNASGDLTITWTPRRRGSGGWPNGVDLPATESPEAYLLQIATDGTFATVLRQPGASTATYTYTAAMQTADFGSLQSSIHVRVAQAGAAAYGYWAEGTL